MFYIYANIMPYDDLPVRNKLFNTSLKQNFLKIRIYGMPERR